MQIVGGAAVERPLFGILALALSAGCTATKEPRPVQTAIYVASPPPSPLDEIPSGQARPDMVWVAGYWHWNGVRYVWIPGHWEPQRPDRAWQPPSYSFAGGRWMYRPGQWALTPAQR